MNFTKEVIIMGLLQKMRRDKRWIVILVAALVGLVLLGRAL